MEKACFNCDLHNICRYYIKTRQISMLELPWNLTDELLKDVKMRLPDHCGHYTEIPKLEGDRDSLGRIFHRTPLKLWYPLAKPEPCKCWHCNGGYGDQCFSMDYKKRGEAAKYYTSWRT